MSREMGNGWVDGSWTNSSQKNKISKSYHCFWNEPAELNEKFTPMIDVHFIVKPWYLLCWCRKRQYRACPSAYTCQQIRFLFKGNTKFNVIIEYFNRNP